VVNSGAPDAWFSGTLSLRNAPTWYGVASISVRRDGRRTRVELVGDPPRGWRLRLPGKSEEMRLATGPQTFVVED
jgi:hypothetical protein